MDLFTMQSIFTFPELYSFSYSLEDDIRFRACQVEELNVTEKSAGYAVLKNSTFNILYI